MIRLSKYLAECGVASRRKAEDIISSGRVKVNGKTETKMGVKVDPEKDRISIDEEVLRSEDKVYFALNKPKGYTSTVSDPHAKHTVLELINTGKRIFPVGRLDKDTTGLLILTNDGEFTDKLTHPRHEKEKEYVFTTKNRLSKDNIKNLEEGITLEGKKTAPTDISEKGYTKDKSTYAIILKEGRKRQIRHMLDRVGHPIIELTRTRIGTLELKDLKEGKYKKLNKKEVGELKND